MIATTITQIINQIPIMNKLETAIRNANRYIGAELISGISYSNAIGGVVKGAIISTGKDCQIGTTWLLVCKPDGYTSSRKYNNYYFYQIGPYINNSFYEIPITTSCEWAFVGCPKRTAHLK